MARARSMRSTVRSAKVTDVELGSRSASKACWRCRHSEMARLAATRVTHASACPDTDDHRV